MAKGFDADGLCTAMGVFLAEHAPLAVAFGELPVVVDAADLKATVFPRVSIGEIQPVISDLGCGAEYAVTVTVHVWTSEAGLVACRRISTALETALNGFDPDVAGFSLKSHEAIGLRTLRDPKPGIGHGFGSKTYNFNAA